MAFSNYIAQSLLATALFYGFGLGLFGAFERWQQVWVVLIIWILTFMVALVALRFRYGPLEHLWRTLTYWNLKPPMTLFGLNKNIGLLALAQPFALATSPALVLISGFIGAHLSPSKELATLPLSMMIIGITLGAMPSALLTRKIGRKRVFIGAMMVSLVSCALASLGITFHSFWLFLVGVTLLGCTLAAIHQFRFAALDRSRIDCITWSRHLGIDGQ